MDTGVAFMLSKCLRHFKSSHCVHVGGYDGYPMVDLFGVLELVFTDKVHICSASDFASFGSKEDILKIQFDVVDNIWHLVSVKARCFDTSYIFKVSWYLKGKFCQY